jgi:hypothetical protein
LHRGVILPPTLINGGEWYVRDQALSITIVGQRDIDGFSVDFYVS